METPRFTGRAVVAFSTDRDVISRTGKAWVVADLARVYGFTDVAGNLPPVIADIETMERVSGVVVGRPAESAQSIWSASIMDG
jgi:hypothetical protein